MRIGHDDNFLSVEKVGQNSCPFWRFEATVHGAGWMIAAVYDRIVVNTSSETVGQLIDFARLTTKSLRLELSEGGWLQILRDDRGYLLIRYRVGQVQAGAALEGEIVLEARSAARFCENFNALF